MTMFRGAILAPCFLAALLLCGCGNNPVSSKSDEPEDISATPRADAEAEEMALYISRQLVAPEALYQRVKTDLLEIRTLFADSGHLPDVAFAMWTPPGQVLLKISTTLLNDSTTAAFHHFDSLNTYFRLESVHTYQYLSQYYKLRFYGLLHAVRLAQAYREVDGILSASAGPTAGDRPNIYPVQHGHSIRYYIREAGGDCPAGCIHSYVHCVDANDEGYTYVGGHYNWSEDEPPDWWPGFLNAWEDYHWLGYND